MIQNPSPSLPSNHFQKKKRIEPTARRESRAGDIAHTTTLDRPIASNPSTHHNPRSHRSRRTPAPTRSLPWPTHVRSLSFSIYLSLSLNCRSLSPCPFCSFVSTNPSFSTLKESRYLLYEFLFRSYYCLLFFFFFFNTMCSCIFFSYFYFRFQNF